MKNVLFITYGFSLGGAETFLINLLNGLDKSKIKPIVVSLGEGNELISRLNTDIAFYELKRRWKYDLAPAFKIARLIKQFEIEKVFAVSLFCYFFVYISRYLVKIPIKIFISLHSTKPRSIKDFVQNWIFFRLLGDEQLIAICEYQVTYLSKIYQLKKEKFKIIYNGVDPAHWTLMKSDFNREEFRKELDIQNDDLVIIQVAGFRKEKSHIDSIRALKLLHEKYNLKAYLIFNGDGDKKIIQMLKNMVLELEIKKYVKFCGKQMDVRPYYWVSDLFTLSSISIETFSIAALESMSCGLPAVLTDLGGAKEMILEGISGFVIPPGRYDKLAEGWFKILHKKTDFDPNRIREIIEKKFSLIDCVQGYEKLLFD
ncbi:MAG: glycosyltransferase family 4 protein [Ignavibacteriaceae bacterium]|jgi:glycosyltransferase involved in cell wall biosynthesis